MKYLTNNISRARGFTLVELMVAITIGLIILAAISTLFVNSKKTYTTQDNLSRLQENARFAMQFLIKDLRLAGYYGCVVDIIDNQTVYNKVTAGTAFENNISIPLEGMNGASGTWYPSGTLTSTPTGIRTGTDAITIRMADASSNIKVTSAMATEGSAIPVNVTTGLNNNDVVVVSDCSVANVVPVTVTTATSLTPAASLSKIFAPSSASNALNGTRVMKFITRKYFIAMGASGNPALFRQDSSAGVAGNPVEIVDGIENIQILYGVNTDQITPKIPNTYLAAGATGLTTAAQWASVVSVRIGLLVRTANDKETDIDTGSYDIDGTGTNNFTAPGDRYKRRVFQTVVYLRNAQ